MDIELFRLPLAMGVEKLIFFSVKAVDFTVELAGTKRKKTGKIYLPADEFLLCAFREREGCLHKKELWGETREVSRQPQLARVRSFELNRVV